MSAPRSPSGEAPAPQQGPPWPLIAVVATVLVVRLIVGAEVHLTEDEAYYRLWSMAPALGYYDHPPMIAWWIWLGRQLAGDTALGMRLVPILAGAATTLLVFDLARTAGAGRRAATTAAVWFNAMPLVGVGGLLAVPDAPASFFWTASLCCAVRAARRSSASWWIGAGAAAGLACFSKYSGLFLAPGMLLWLALSPGGRTQLGKPGPWIGAAVALLVFSRNVVWNAHHHWLTFAKQFGRVAPTHFAPWHLPEFLGEQFLLLNPLIAVVLVVGFASRRQRSGEGADLTPLIATSAPFAAYLLLHSLHDQVQAHWPAPIYPAMAVCAGVAAERLAVAGAWTKLRLAAPVLGFAVFGVFCLCLIAPARWWPRDFDPLLPLQGWSRFAGEVRQTALGGGTVWIGTASYGLTAQLADEPLLKEPVLQLDERARYGSLPLALPDLSRPGLIVDLPRRVDLAALRRCFSFVGPEGSLARGPPGGKATLYAAVQVAGARRAVDRFGCW
ncbi:MAG TPA: glycosyltransferase family 39 protein [Caulobacteraceae bacterium]